MTPIVERSGAIPGAAIRVSPIAWQAVQVPSTSAFPFAALPRSPFAYPHDSSATYAGSSGYAASRRNFQRVSVLFPPRSARAPSQSAIANGTSPRRRSWPAATSGRTKIARQAFAAAS